MRLLVTGGAGFIGSNLVRSTLGQVQAVERLVVLDKLTYAGNVANLTLCEKDARYRLVVGDIGDRHLVGKVLREEKITAVMHLAAESHVDRSIDGPEAFVETNVVGTLALLRSVLEYWKSGVGGNGFRFLHVSTDEVYGTLGLEDAPFTETTPYAPNSPYAASKAASDHLVRAFHHTYGLPVVTTNCSNNYGPFQFPEKLIPLVILNALQGKALPIYGDGKSVRDWLYVEDHATALRVVLEKGQIGEVYNIGGNCERNTIQIVDALCALLDRCKPREDGKSYATQKAFVKDRPGHDRRYAINASKLLINLGWKPTETFETGLERTVRWYLEHAQWCEEIRQKLYAGERLGAGSN
jgi:dTDP-glucose 4,6-dehydratase